MTGCLTRQRGPSVGTEQKIAQRHTETNEPTHHRVRIHLPMPHPPMMVPTAIFGLLILSGSGIVLLVSTFSLSLQGWIQGLFGCLAVCLALHSCGMDSTGGSEYHRFLSIERLGSCYCPGQDRGGDWKASASAHNASLDSIHCQTSKASVSGADEAIEGAGAIPGTTGKFFSR